MFIYFFFLKSVFDHSRVGGHVGQESRPEQRDHNEPDRLVSVAGGGVNRRFSHRSRPLLHSSNRLGRVYWQT